MIYPVSMYDCCAIKSQALNYAQWLDTLTRFGWRQQTGDSKVKTNDIICDDSVVMGD